MVSNWENCGVGPIVPVPAAVPHQLAIVAKAKAKPKPKYHNWTIAIPAPCNRIDPKDGILAACRMRDARAKKRKLESDTHILLTL